ncbi:MAG: rhomboid family intramembrane serine protease [Proteobacteria bacterium]|nr:rhomboid family intramembrane serine protease [Pseudomonadota bacterium]MBU1388785.1 rhomboid family intramembrane serine protease [Pseudomonadota bacterium]MBU1543126.1 rhomboid family intramembrane serine protease [Pseudomonadota bacterium]MBU2431035.1 rhomboid family intramembrane serine protease [Pseudomonadota bacterium]MBU2481716.1 rhomboid family intramembrane serine protease [Pseudomonadota bacterium]
MIPIRDHQISGSFPVVTYGLIAVNLLVFMVQLQIGLDNQAFFYYFGLVPAKYTVYELSQRFSLFNHIYSMFTYMFLHGGFLHFLGNMWSLYIFGDNVEDHFGSVRFLGFYLLCGIISGLCHFFLTTDPMMPTIGASGAIAGVMGAYFLLYPKARILTLIPIIIIPWFIEVPAFIFLGFWFFLQLVNAAGSSAGAGIAWWAHIGGFIAGIILVKMNQGLPQTGVQKSIRQYTEKKRTPRLQMIAAKGSQDSWDLQGEIEITPFESIIGANKTVTIPWGFYNPLYTVKIPPGVKQGTRLRLARMGKIKPDGAKGDMYLKVNIKHAG